MSRGLHVGAPAGVEAQGWKAKIRDRERTEPPHVTLLFKTNQWRLSLRTGAFLDREPPPHDVPRGLAAYVTAQFVVLRTEWDAMYPENPVGALP